MNQLRMGFFESFEIKGGRIKWSQKLKELRDQDSMVESPEKTEDLV